MLVVLYHSWAFTSHLEKGHESYPVPILPYVLICTRSMEHSYEQELVTSHPSSPMTKLAVLDHVSASAKVTATFFLSSASPWGGRAGCRSTARGCWQHSRQNWASLTLPGSGQGYLPWFAHKPQVKRRGSKKRGERINLEEFLDPASAPYTWQDGAEQREWLSIQHVYTEMLSGKYLICDATQKYLAPGDLLGWADTQLFLHQMDTSVCIGSTGHLPGT